MPSPNDSPRTEQSQSGSPVPRGVWSGSLFLGLGRFAGAAATALELVFAARVLDGAAFGRWTFLLAALVLVESASDMGTGAAALQRGAENNGAFRSALEAARRARRLTVAVAAMLLLLLGSTAGEDPRWLLLACILPLSRLFETSGLAFQHTLDWSPVVGSRVVGAVARGVLVPVLLLSGVHDVGALLAAHAAGLALGNVLVHAAARAHGRVPQRTSSMVSLWPLALPLGCATLAHQAALYADNWILLELRGEEQLGHYNAAARIASFLLLFAANAGIVALPWLARRSHAGRLGEATSRLSRTLLLPMAILLGLIAPQADLLLEGAFGSAFVVSTRSLQVLLVSALVVNATTGWLTALVASGDGRAVLRLTLAALLFNVAGNFALVPRFGGVGAAAATLLTEVLLSGGAWATLRSRGSAPVVTGRAWFIGVAAFLLSILASAGARALLES